MNCANHPDRERVAFCQNCGKPLCTDCARNVGSSIFCEPCLSARVAGTAPPHTAYGYAPQAGYGPGYQQTGYQQPGYMPPGQASPSGVPNPGLAALLGFIPGVGAMYNEQYAKGIVHLMVFAVLVSLTSDVNDIFLIFVFGWEFYMAIEAHHTAKARRDGTPLPNPFGLNDLSERLGFGRAWPNGVPPADSSAPNPGVPPANPYAPPAGAYAPPYTYSYVPPTSQWGAPVDSAAYAVPPAPSVPPAPPMPGQPDATVSYMNRFPSAAVWLIGLGVLFLLSNIPVFHLFRGRLFVPIFFIGMGVWLFVRRMLDTGPGFENDGTAYYHWRLHRALRGSLWMVLIGVLWLLSALHILGFGHSWPVFLIAVGVMLFFKRTYGYGYVAPPQPGMTTPPVTPVTTTAIVPSGTMHDAASSGQPGDGEEGR